MYKMVTDGQSSTSQIYNNFDPNFDFNNNYINVFIKCKNKTIVYK